MLLRPVEDKVKKGNAIRQGIISNNGCTENCIRLRINAADKNAGNKQDIVACEQGKGRGEKGEKEREKERGL